MDQEPGRALWLPRNRYVVKIRKKEFVCPLGFTIVGEGTNLLVVSKNGNSNEQECPG
jgi:hypothetical protein